MRIPNQTRGHASVFWFPISLIRLSIMPINSICYSIFRVSNHLKVRNSKKNETDETTRAKGRRILLVENSIISAVHFESVLRRWNFKIDIVTNAEQAIQKVNSMHYDILFLDVQMPGPWSYFVY